ncbi:LuxR C-terminal-related transcriptional regulator [Deinococcus oregonensis]|uniref:LuxR C-terminal-related transcriptional regulator n=1 Tax=Deinococcus oregonensis TaxID=1805970 RepID=A0ABV6AXL9_9DEIO
MGLTMQASSLVLAGRLTEARALLEEALDWTQGIHNHIGRSWSWLILAVVELHADQPVAAEEALRRVLEVGLGLQVPDLQIGGLIGMAALLAQQGRPTQALEYWSAAETLQAARNYNAGLMRMMSLFWMAPLLARQQEPELARAVQAGQSLDVTALIGELVATGIPDEHLRPPVVRVRTPFALTPRETQVLGLLAQGLSNKQIAAQLGSGVYTVNDQVKAVFSKLGVSNRAAATRYALEHGLG